MKPFVYDFKRSFLRLSTLLFLVLFAVAGIGISYTVSSSLGSNRDFRYSALGYVMAEPNETTVVAMAIGPNGEPAGGVEFEVNGSVNGNSVISSALTNSSGMAEISIKGPVVLRTVSIKELGNLTQIVEFAPGSVTGASAPTYTHYRSIAFGIASPYTYMDSPLASSGQEVFPGQEVCAIVTNYFSNGSIKVYISSGEPLSIYYTYTNSIGLTGVRYYGENVSVPAGYHFLGNQTEGINSYIIKVNKSSSSLTLSLFYRFNSSTLGSTSPSHSSNPSYGSSSIVFTTTPPINLSEIESFVSSLAPFLEFSPIIFLYLAYALLAKPRSTGALEFLLSKSITKEEVFINRFLGGVITAFVSAGIFMPVTDVYLYLLTGVSFSFVKYLYVFLGISLSLVAFYSLMFLVSGAVSGSGTFLGLSVFIYVFFNYIELIVERLLEANGIHIGKYENYVTYVAPLYFLLQGYGHYNVPLEVIDVLLWIFLPVSIGFLLFTELFKKRKLLRQLKQGS